MSDNKGRAVCKELMSLVREGVFSPIIDFVKKHDELELCFRGNSNEIVIYFNNHVAFKLSGTCRENASVEVNVDHARYTENWRKELGKLGIYGVEIKKIRRKIKSGSYSFSYTAGGYMKLPELPKRAKKYSGDFWKDKWDILRGLMRDYFDPEKNIDQFRRNFIERHETEDTKTDSPTPKNPYIEKIRQQQIFTAYSSMENEYYIYDLEFAEEGEYTGGNKPDALAVKFINGKADTLVFVEVKSTTSAITGEKSGFISHLNGMVKKLDEKGTAKKLVDGAEEIILQYYELGLRNAGRELIGGKFFTDEERKNLINKQQIVFIFTDEAWEYYKKPQWKKYYADSLKDETVKKYDPIILPFGTL